MIESAVMAKQQRNIVRVAACAAVAAMLIWIGAAVAVEGSYPVKLNPRLGLASVDDAAIEVRLDQPIPASEAMLPPAEYVKFRDDWRTIKGPYDELVVDRVKPTSCTQLIALVDAGYVPWNEPVYLDDCTALRLLRRARPARESYVRDFVMSAEAVDFLPAMLDTSDLADRRCQAYIANRRGVPWSVFDKIVKVHVIHDSALTVWTEYRDGRFENDDGSYIIAGGWTHVDIMAWGDLNGDGVENLLIVASSNPVTWRPTLGNYSIHGATYGKVFVLTRDAPGAVLRVIDAERYLKPQLLEPEPCPYPGDRRPAEETAHPTR